MLLLEQFKFLSCGFPFYICPCHLVCNLHNLLPEVFIQLFFPCFLLEFVILLFGLVLLLLLLTAVNSLSLEVPVV